MQTQCFFQLQADDVVKVNSITGSARIYWNILEYTGIY